MKQGRSVVAYLLVAISWVNLSVFANEVHVNPLPDIRRIVTGNNAHGDSYIMEDRPANAIVTTPKRPGYRVVNIWRTQGMPVNLNETDTILEQKGILPPENGTILRVIDFPPEPKDSNALRKQLEATFNGLYSDANYKKHQYPGTHQTETLDYAIILEGEIIAKLDKDETVMREGDILIQRGTTHAWVNRSNKTARVAFILIDAARPQGDTQKPK